MLSIHKGDLIESVKENAIVAHGCNAQGRMNSGFALQLRRKYPINHLYYVAAARSKALILGNNIHCNYYHADRQLSVVNMITQEFYGRDKHVVYVNYEAVESCMEKAACYAKLVNLPLHFPFIGGGLANGNRDRLMGIFESCTKDIQANLWIPT